MIFFQLGIFIFFLWTVYVLKQQIWCFSCFALNSALAKTEHKIVQDLKASGICETDKQLQENVETWERSLEELDRSRQEMVA